MPAEGRLERAVSLLARGAVDQAESLLRPLVTNTCLGPAANETDCRTDFGARRALAEVSTFRGDYQEAVAVLEIAGSRVLRGLGADSIEMAVASNDLGVNFKYLGRFEDATLMYARARRIIERLEPEGPLMAALLHNLAGLAHSEGRPAAGEEDARRGIELRIELCGPDHVEVAADLANLAGLLEAQGKMTAAESTYRRAIEILFQTYGRSHHEVATNLGNLAAVMEATGRFAESEELYAEALPIACAVYGERHPETMRLLNNLAFLYLVSDRKRLAAAAYEQVVSVLAPVVHAEHPVLRSARDHLANDFP